MDVLNDAEVRALYLGYVRAGLGPHECARLIGLRAFQVKLYLARHPDLLELVTDALGEATEPVVMAAYALALRGNTDMIKLWLAANAPDKFGAKPTHVTNNLIIGGDDALIRDLTASLEARKQELAGPAAIPVASVEVPASRPGVEPVEAVPAKAL